MTPNLKYLMSIIKIENALAKIKLPAIFQTLRHQNYVKSNNKKFKARAADQLFVGISKENARELLWVSMKLVVLLRSIYLATGWVVLICHGVYTQGCQ